MTVPLDRPMIEKLKRFDNSSITNDSDLRPEMN
jgi:hypothetical protein